MNTPRHARQQSKPSSQCASTLAPPVSVRGKAMLYTDCVAPAKYHCARCPVIGVKLWRQYQTFADHLELMCAACALVDQKKEGPVDDQGRRPSEHGDTTDSIGWLVPAVPTEEGDTFWGYTSVPAPGAMWWRLLPTQQPDSPLRARERAQAALDGNLDTLASLERLHLSEFVPAALVAISMAEEVIRHANDWAYLRIHAETT